MAPDAADLPKFSRPPCFNASPADEEGPGAADDDELWKDNWEDEEPDDDFIAQLRAEQAKLA